MIGRAYMGEVLTQVWLKSVKKWVSYLTKKWMYKKRIWKIFWVHAIASSHKPMIKVCDENETRKKRQAPKIFFDGRKEFIRRVWKARAMDIKRLQVKDFWYVNWRYYLFSKWVNRCQGDDFWAWAHERVPLNSQWLVLRIGSAEFLHGWVANSIIFMVRTCWVVDN